MSREFVALTNEYAAVYRDLLHHVTSDHVTSELRLEGLEVNFVKGMLASIVADIACYVQ